MFVENQPIRLPVLTDNKISLFIKREDLIHPLISGNKYRKLKYNLIKAREDGFDALLTFGGAYSNHIAATAYAGKVHGFKTIGIIRGEELEEKWRLNPTLKLAKEHGMQFKFVSRDVYGDKDNIHFHRELENEFGSHYLLPEGGTNALAIKGCEEILTPNDNDCDVLCCSVGTGGTLAGISNAALPHQQVLGFPALKGDFLQEDIRKFARKENWVLQTAYHFGGYAKVSKTLVDFVNDFYKQTQILLDPIYTGKMMFGLLDMAQNKSFKPRTRILAVHTGGLQGIEGMNRVLKQKKLPLINVHD
ncbi:1-aminocyclopropane-1-carboxylate deaminase/D-cysteine desulfhydrase [Ulvibacterium marinum]|uniref:1-aminocyclopropane-1-carboxylate deaminase/D-cysteine desulfhydrase n=1 Tax=Ulvibacterium marinum TaxID=2419782 RepID=A0A3B0CAN3_9FLAO|nr:pyridoxal-phosphate dependent enzyme [Ulvibacterium marinum]RKN83575.1 1-aminocyclopropane-1-carboxylate deaminase/D-cysteine desulfhydrase [Ulvibacterium marinum]